jgi:hypothetical protein
MIWRSFAKDLIQFRKQKIEKSFRTKKKKKRRKGPATGPTRGGPARRRPEPAQPRTLSPSLTVGRGPHVSSFFSPNFSPLSLSYWKRWRLLPRHHRALNGHQDLSYKSPRPPLPSPFRSSARDTMKSPNFLVGGPHVCRHLRTNSSSTVSQVIRLQHIYNFWCSMLVFTPFA